MELEQLIRDLQRRKVELVVTGGQPVLRIPETLPEADWVRANRACHAGIETLAANREQVAEVWRRVAKEVPEPERCGECRAWIFCVPDPVSRWAFCISRSCPHRTDEAARIARWHRDRDRQREKQENETVIPD